MIFRRTKFGDRPGRRAQNVVPARQGDTYSYTVDKFWIVESVGLDGTATLRTRRGKQHAVSADDLRLRKTTWWERWLYRDRFRAITKSPFNQETLSALSRDDAVVRQP